MPYPNEHAARLRDPADFDPDSFRRTNGGTIYGSKTVPATIGIIWGKLKGANAPSDNPIPQALRFPTADWTAAEARKWLSDNEITTVSFEPASESDASAALPELRFTHAQKAAVARSAGGRRIVGYASVFYDGTPETEYQLWSDTVERIMPGAFDTAIKEDDVRALFNHEPANVLGRTAAGTLALAQDATGLHYEIELPDTHLANDLSVLVGRGDITGSSFAFQVRKQTIIEPKEANEPTVRQIEDVALFDVGPVTYPAYEQTTAMMRAANNRAQLMGGDTAALKAYQDAMKKRLDKLMNW